MTMILDQTLPGNFKMGFTPFPSTLDAGALDLTYSQIKQHSDGPGAEDIKRPTIALIDLHP